MGAACGRGARRSRQQPPGTAGVRGGAAHAPWGRNELRSEQGPGPGRILRRQFASPLIYILAVAALVALAVGEPVDAAVIAAVLVINAAVGFFQEYRAERSLAALRRLATNKAVVMRERGEREVDAAQLVPGDVILLAAGARVPADARLLSGVSLEADESLLTGESVPAPKSARPCPADAPLAERSSMLWTGTVITRGHGRAVVTATGARTELGAIAGSLRARGEVATPLQQRMERFARVVGAAVLLVALAGFAAGAARGQELDVLFLGVVALAVSAIPEGLPIVLTVALAISVRRMVAAQAVVRRLPAVESLGSCTVIGSDKTGTLTQNRMTVVAIAAGGRSFEVSAKGSRVLDGIFTGDGEPVDPGEEPTLARILLAGALCNDASVAEDDGDLQASGDPTEVALLVAAARAGMYRDELEETLPRRAEIPFETERQYAATLHEEAGGERLLLVKGSPERVIGMCSEAASGRGSALRAALDRADEMAREGLRVLAMAGRRIHAGEAFDPGDEPTGLTFYGLQGMIDPPRAQAPAAVQGCRRAGIRVLMITGDHAVTAGAVARGLGIAGEGDQVLTGADIARLGDLELDGAIGRVSVFARVAPEHKLRIVEGLRRRGEIVAVTGDGVNDAPALKAADIGAAMGSGTDVAKEAADIVVLDDDFSSIYRAVGEGRTAFDNIRKTTFFLVSSGVAEVLAVLAAILAGLPLPFLPAQLLWLNLVTNGVQDVALAFEPGEPGRLDRRPRSPREGIVSRLLWERTAIAGAVMAAGTLGLFIAHLDDPGHGAPPAGRIACPERLRRHPRGGHPSPEGGRARRGDRAGGGSADPRAVAARAVRVENWDRSALELSLRMRRRVAVRAVCGAPAADPDHHRLI